MTNVLILGANGQLARNTTKFFLECTDVRPTLYLRRAGRLQNPDPSRVTFVDADVLDETTLMAATEGQAVVYANHAGAMEKQARTIAAAMRATGVKRLIFISSRGSTARARGNPIAASSTLTGTPPL